MKKNGKGKKNDIGYYKTKSKLIFKDEYLNNCRLKGKDYNVEYM